MAGFSLGAKMAHIGSVMGHGSGDILLDELNCKGDEQTILECKYNPWTQHDCRIREWAGVTCQDQEICSEEVIIRRLYRTTLLRRHIDEKKMFQAFHLL